ncbi:acyltransferase [Pseudoalteromonas agarivorans]|uniref:acyltransferase family protein n=1 Tax=Pseudoalteromonas agarivorans TaxID=176102 RepID=UPI0021183110|nr:acyltransferase family protein [Pseudoalteromonas agarivorans]MCQ8819295.1 acyltransferase [Pseudoalteromonas agarivorans]
MQFREDINGLRAIAVIAVVLFHFNSTWMPGGFAGVDVFFVISGFLMTGIIFKRLEQDKFSVLSFYIARANRIIPALSFLCFVLLVLGWFYISPVDYKTLGMHSLSSISFVSNIVYWRESGYFDVASHEKWLLHTWSLSVEWQFYIIYPLILTAFRKFMPFYAIKMTILMGTILGFLFCILATTMWPEAAYYLLPTRAWEMMLGGVAYLFPFESLTKKNKKILELLGLGLIIYSYIFISKDNPWPGYLSIIPVIGTFFIIQANNKSSITGNFLFQKIGTWSYSIYLWHWPLVVAISYFSLNKNYIYFGIILSALLGYLSNKYIEKIKFRNDFKQPASYLHCKPIYVSILIGLLGSVVFFKDGFINLSSEQYQLLINNSQSSPFRDKCNIKQYRDPNESCEYFGSDISWATLGDSHSVEIAYALAKRLEPRNIGIKEFSFSGCRVSYQETEEFGKCTKWYNETVEYILNDKKIKNVVFNHRFTGGFYWGEPINYPNHNNSPITSDILRITKNIDELIKVLASSKNNIYIFYPIPELQRDIKQLIGTESRNEGDLVNIYGTDLAWYKERNKYIINHFDNSNYPSNVHFLKPQDVFFDKANCYAVKDGTPLYFDDDHPSLLGATKLVELINLD